MAVMKKWRHRVVPLAGTWIEIIMDHTGITLTTVVPLAGTWIEM